MSICEPGDEPTIIAAANELNNILQYRGLSPDQRIQALIAVSASFLSVVSRKDRELLEENLKMFCRCLRERSREDYKSCPPFGR